MVELIVVIAILGILASVLYPKMSGREEAAKIQCVESDMLHIYEAAESWKQNNGKADFNGLTYATLTGANLWSGKKNPWGNDYALATATVGGFTDGSVSISSGILPSINVQTSLRSRLQAKGYTVTTVGTPISLSFTAPY